MLLGHLDRLSRVADLYAKRTSGRSDAEVLVAEATHEIEGLLWLLLLSQPQRVGLDLRFDRGTHMRCCTKETIRRHAAVDALMRTLEVVVLDEELDPPKTVREISEHRLAQKLLPQRLPEALDLAERLGMLRAALAVLDAVTPQQLLKLGRAAPRSVLATLIGQDLARLAVVRDAALERLDDQAALLVVGHRPRHEVARVVVHEADQVHALMTAQLEREDVALPELVGLRAFEATRWLVTRSLLLLRLDEPCLVQDATHRRLRDAQALEASQHIADATRAPLRVGLARCDHLGRRRLLQRRRATRRLRG